FGWQSWRAPWMVAQEGEYELCCRATDATGSVQPLTTRWNAQGMCNNQVQRITVVVGQQALPVQPLADGIPLIVWRQWRRRAAILDGKSSAERCESPIGG